MMDHLLPLLLCYFFIGFWYLKPKVKIAPILSIIFGLIAAVIQFGSAGSAELFLQHFSLDMFIIAAALYILQFFKHLEWAILILLGLGAVIGLFHQFQPFDFDDEIGHSEILIHFSSLEDKERILSDYADLIIETKDAFNLKDSEFTDLDDYLELDLIESIDPYKFIKKIENDEGVIWVEFNQRVEVPDLIELTNFTDNIKSGFNDPYSINQWHLERFSISSMHEKLALKPIQSPKNILIAILDTGIDSQHEDLSGRYKSFGNKQYDTDDRGHGTHCAGIAASISNNELGIASILPAKIQVEVTSIKVLNRSGFGTQQTIINGILKAADIGADVISLSLGGITSESKEKAYTEAVAYANSKGSIVVVAAGNSSRDAIHYSPANTPGVIAVTAIDSTMKIAAFANSVERLEMGIAAPGVNILSTFPNNQYKRFNGTSMAAPFVAGMLAVLKSYHPQMNTKEAYDIMTKTSSTTQNNHTPILLPDNIVEIIQ